MENGEKPRICCVHRLGNHENHELISLEDTRKVTLGRAVTNDVCLNEAQCISRQHALLEKNENDLWTVTDLNSGNGLIVNGEYITPSVQLVLKDKDIIELGKDPNTNEPAAYKFQFHRAVKIKIKQNREANDEESGPSDSGFKPPPLKRLRPDNKVGPSPNSQVRQRLAEQERLLREEMQRKEKEAEEKLKEMESILAEREAAQKRVIQDMEEYRQKMEAEVRQQKELGDQHAKEKDNALLKIKESEEAAENRVKELQLAMESKDIKNQEVADKLVTEKEQVLQQLEEHKQEREKLEEHQKAIQSRVEEMNAQLQDKHLKQEEMTVMVEEMKQQKDSLEVQMSQQKIQLEKEKELLATEMQQKLEQELKEQENKLKQQLLDEISQLQDEKQQVEHSLQEEMKKAIEQKDKILEEELKKKQEELLKALNEKEEEQRSLVAEIERHKESGEKEKHKLVEGIEDLMEEELVCSICSELFVQAMSLSCSHSFCTYCIKEWMLRKMQCPNCRQPIVSCVRSIVLDNYIDKMLEYLSDDMKERRGVLVTERKAAQEAQKKKEEESRKKAEQGRRVTNMAAAAAAQPARVQNILDTIVMISPVGQNGQVTLQNVRVQAPAQVNIGNAAQARQPNNANIQRQPAGHQARTVSNNRPVAGGANHNRQPVGGANHDANYYRGHAHGGNGRNVFAVGNHPHHGGPFDRRVAQAAHQGGARIRPYIPPTWQR